MLIELNYLQHRRSLDVLPLLAPLCDIARTGDQDLANLRVSLDWIPYRYHFREIMTAGRSLNADGSRNGLNRLSVNVREAKPEALSEHLAGAFRRLAETAGEADDRVYLEEFKRPSASITWAFNSLFWRELSAWQTTFKRHFTQALPGGGSDARNEAFIHHTIERFMANLAELGRHWRVPEEIFVLEIGVGTGEQTLLWLDAFKETCHQGGKPYYDRVQYLMCDYSRAALDAAYARVARHHGRVNTLVLDALDPLRSLGFLRYKVLFAHVSNVYDNLPTDELIRSGGRDYAVQVRAYVPRAEAEAICARYALKIDEFPTTVRRFLKVGPDYLGGGDEAVLFWRDVWQALRLDEQYVAVDAIDLALAPGLGGEHVQRLLANSASDLRMHLSNGALSSFINTLPLLHPKGMFLVQDIIVTDLEQYRGGFRGPGKLDGSIVNWVNGPLLAAVADRHGYCVQFEPFLYRSNSNIVIMTTNPKD